MSKSSISDLLDGAAFPAIMLAVAVSQIEVGPHRRDTLSPGKGAAGGLQVDDRVKQRGEAVLVMRSPGGTTESAGSRNRF